jgi:hypothetical protein
MVFMGRLLQLLVSTAVVGKTALLVYLPSKREVFARVQYLDYRHPILGVYDKLILYSGGLFGVFVPWLPAILRRLRGRGENGAINIVMALRVLVWVDFTALAACR